MSPIEKYHRLKEKQLLFLRNLQPVVASLCCQLAEMERMGVNLRSRPAQITLSGTASEAGQSLVARSHEGLALYRKQQQSLRDFQKAVYDAGTKLAPLLYKLYDRWFCSGHLQSQLEKYQELVVEHQARLDAIVRDRLSPDRADLCGAVQQIAQAAVRRIEQLREESGRHIANNAAELAGWNDNGWRNWRPPQILTPAALRIGEYSIDFVAQAEVEFPARFWEQVDQGIREAIEVCSIPLVGSGQSVVLVFDRSTEDVANGLLQSMLMRIVGLLPYHVHFTLLDPVGHGQAFPMRQAIRDCVRPRVRDVADDTVAALREVVDDIRRIRDNVFGYVERLDLLDHDTLATEKYEFIFAANFPRGYSRQAIDLLLNIAVSGPPAGKFVVLQHNLDVEMPRDVNLEELSGSHVVRLVQTDESVNKIQFDAAPPREIIESLTHLRESHRPEEHRVQWMEVVGLPESSWWQESSVERILTPVGGKNGDLQVWFGTRDSVACSHGMLAGTTGSGKSSLYHTLIMGLAIRYNPRQLRMILVDGKDGVEFQPYQELPHASVVSLQSLPELSRSVLSEMLREKERRHELFSQAGVTDLGSYNRAVDKESQLERILVIVDEYQELFEDDRDGSASAMLLQLASQGRSAGIHMLLGSQRFGVPNLLNQAAVFNNIHLRMAMRMTQEGIQTVAEFGPQGRQLIRACDQAGKIVINDRSGDDVGNRFGKVSYLESEARSALLTKLRQKAEDDSHGQIRPPIVFQGSASPRLSENRSLWTWLQDEPEPVGPERRERFARRAIDEYGLGKPDWLSAESPIAWWLGQEFNVFGQTLVTLRRLAGQNVSIVGSDGQARAGMMAGCVLSIAALYTPGEVEFYIVDRTIAQASGSETLPTLARDVLQPLGFECGLYADSESFATMVDRLTRELESRTHDGGYGRPSILFVIAEPDRLANLRRPEIGTREVPGLYGQMARLLSEGPPCGIHTVVSAAGYRILAQVFDERRELRNFGHRVALQMSEDDSFAFVRSRRAAALQAFGARPICGLYVDIERAPAGVRFKPYTSASLPAEISRILSALRCRLHHTITEEATT